jgi:cytochrome c oxidase subunit I
VLYVAFISMAAAHHLLVDPGMGPAWKVVNTSYFMYMAVLASMLHGFTVPAGIEVGQRLRGYGKGTFDWLKRAPWGDPGFSSLAFSIVVFGFVGGITGVTFGTEQINIIAHNTLRIPGHFHATVVSGTAMAFMGLTYYVIPLIFRKKVAFWPLAKIQPYLFAGGMLIFSMAMTFAGTFAVPRRHWDITFQRAVRPPVQPHGGPAPRHHGAGRAHRRAGRGHLHPGDRLVGILWQATRGRRYLCRCTDSRGDS